MNVTRRSLIALACAAASSALACRMPTNAQFEGEPFARLTLFFES